ncbi:hypothetical protein, partial [uncultured Ruminococcus sp.]|uniref:hypothetical protein n=1 Tax=uncultured Ruminococcus sp. TaxID=165186 RepID=UPI0025CF9C0F
QFGCVLFPRRRRGNNTKEQPFCIISNTYQNWEIANAITRCAIAKFDWLKIGVSSGIIIS